MTEISARHALPLLVPGQAQKEVFHNEALAAIDALLHACVEDGPANDPPVTANAGESWIVGDAPSGDWAAQAHALATWTAGGWRFAAPVPGMLAWNKQAGWWMRWTGGAWSGGTLPGSALLIGGQQVVGPQLPEVPSPSGGSTIDVEARAAIAALIATLKSHGLTE